MSGNHTPGPWQPGRQSDTVVAAVPAGHPSGEDVVRHYGGHLVAESIATRNVPLIATAPTLLRRMERTEQAMLAAADSLAAAALVCRINKLTDTARTIETAADHLRSTARLNTRVLERARGTTTAQTDNDQ